MFKIIFIVLLIYLFFQYSYINKINKTLDIYQVDNPNKNEFEKLLVNKSPTIFTNVSENFLSLQEYTLLEILKLTNSYKDALKTNLKNHFEYYTIPLLHKYEFNFYTELKGTNINIKRCYSSRLLLSQLIGAKKIILFSPEQKEYLYINNKNKNSFINFFKDDLTKFPLFKKTKFIEIILYPGQMVYIPFKWYYCYINEEDSVSITCQSESLLTMSLKL